MVFAKFYIFAKTRILTYYSSSGQTIKNWVYDEVNSVMYCVADWEGLYKSERNGDSFETAKLISAGTNSLLSELNVEKYFTKEGHCVVYWKSDEVTNWKTGKKLKLIDDKGKLIPENVVEFIIEENASWYSASGLKLSVDDVDIRFDLFKDIEGFEEIYTATKGLKNEDVIKALDSFKLRNLFYNACSDRYFSDGNTKVQTGAHPYNLVADILYVKDSDTLLCNSEEPIKSLSSNEKPVKGTEYFKKDGNNYSGNGWIDIYRSPNDIWHDVVSSVSDDYKKSDGSADYSAILKDAFAKCNSHGEKEFRLDILKDDAKYGELYSDLTDEAALEWLTEDDERLYTFGLAFADQWDDSQKVNVYDRNFKDLFFIKGTNEAACKEVAKSVNYYDENMKDFTVNSDGSLWASYTNMEKSWETKYFYFVQVIDSDGCLINNFREVNFPAGKSTQTIENDGAFYMKYSLVDSNGAETGFHQIYKVNLEDSSYVNMFANVPNNQRLEVVTYSVGADRLYYSAVRGTAVENGIVSTVTNEYNPLEITKKFSAIYTF